ncbi:MAG TPA: multicopper oxidase domain-containing protein, partial [Candidatus Acidoferrales bacterium]|nr:multicopper oxidase domain-containing protein [Candidatus Acidoferrales bacterium]
ERADVVVDFSPLEGCAGAECNVLLLDDGASGDAGQVMQFKVGSLTAPDTSAIPNALPHQAPLCPAGNACETSTRKVALFDHLLGLFQGGNAVSMKWDEPITETVTLGKNGAATIEVWEIHDLKDDHPIHLHEVQFEVVNREKIATGEVFNCNGKAKNASGNLVDCASPPVPGETGFKDTVRVNGGEITRVRVRFGPSPDDPSPRSGLFAWHCHIIEHEDEEMMRPLCVHHPNDPAPVPGADGIVGNANPSCPSHR